MNDHAYIFGAKKDGAKENVMSKEQLEDARRIAKSICEQYSITWDERATIPTINGKPIQAGDIAKAFRIHDKKGAFDMTEEYYAKLCDARDTLCGYCESAACEMCTVRSLIMNAANDLPEEDDVATYTALLYNEDGTEAEDFDTYDVKEDAINAAKYKNWDEVVDNLSGVVVWKRAKC